MLALNGLYNDIHRWKKCEFLSSEMLTFKCFVCLLLLDTSLIICSQSRTTTATWDNVWKNRLENKFLCGGNGALIEAETH